MLRPSQPASPFISGGPKNLGHFLDAVYIKTHEKINVMVVATWPSGVGGCLQEQRSPEGVGSNTVGD